MRTVLGSNQQHEEAPPSWWRTEFSKWWQVYQTKPAKYWLILLVSCVGMMTAFPASSILTRLYYEDGGKRRWLVAWIAVAGWPITALALLPFYFVHGISPTPLTLPLIIAYSVLGFFSAADNLLFSWAYSYMPASTASLLSSSSLTFTAIFAYFIVGKKLNASTFNAVGVITAAAIILGLDSNSDRPSGVSNLQYAIGFVLDILGSALHGLIFVLSELVFIKLLGRKSIHVVLEQQAMVSLLGFVFTTIGVIASGDFGVLKEESKNFHHGPVAYSMVLIWAAITFQLGILGSVAVLYLTSSLLAGVLNAARVPVTSVAAVIFLHDPMGGYKIIALLLTVWGFGSYIYGGVAELQNRQKSSSSSTLSDSQADRLALEVMDEPGRQTEVSVGRIDR